MIKYDKISWYRVKDLKGIFRLKRVIYKNMGIKTLELESFETGKSISFNPKKVTPALIQYKDIIIQTTERGYKIEWKVVDIQHNQIKDRYEIRLIKGNFKSSENEVWVLLSDLEDDNNQKYKLKQ